MTNLRKYFGFRYSNNRKMFSRNRIKRAPAVAREGCGGSGAPGAGLRGARGARGMPFAGLPRASFAGLPGTPTAGFPGRRLQGLPERRLQVSRSAVRASFRSHPGLLCEALSGRAPDRVPDMFPDIFPDIFSGHCSGRIRSAPGPGKEAERGQPHARGGAEG